jgi:hypothetical protein
MPTIADPPRGTFQPARRRRWIVSWQEPGNTTERSTTFETPAWAADFARSIASLPDVTNIRVSRQVEQSRK